MAGKWSKFRGQNSSPSQRGAHRGQHYSSSVDARPPPEVKTTFFVTGVALKGQHHFSGIFVVFKKLLAGLEYTNVNRAAKSAFFYSRRLI